MAPQPSEYLQPGWDPAKARIVDLRSILVDQNVNYTSSAKKADLVAIFKEQVAPRAPQLLARLEQLQPHGRGIVDAGTLDAPSPSPRRRTRSVSPAKERTARTPASPRKARAKAPAAIAESSGSLLDAVVLAPEVKEAKEVAASPVSPRKKGRKTLSRQSIAPSEEEPVPKSEPSPAKVSIRGSPRKARVSKANAEVEEAAAEDAKSSPFSENNVFQATSPKSAGSPTARKRSKKSDEKPSKRQRKSEVDNDEEMHDVVVEEVEVVMEDVDQSSQAHRTPQQQQHQTPGSVRHFTSFPNTPEEEFVTPSQGLTPRAPATAPAHRDHSFPRLGSSFKSSSKRLSFMPSLSDLRVSAEFERQLLGESTPEPPSDYSDRGETDAALDELNKEVDEEVKAEANGVKTDAEQPVPVSPKPERVHRSRRAPSLQPLLVALVQFLTILGLAAYVGWWIQQRQIVGYCDVNLVQTPPPEPSSAIEHLGNILRPACVPCPEHATCYPHLQVHCDEDFVRVEHPLSFGGTLPFAPSCVSDTDKRRRIVILAQRALQILRQRNADAACSTEPGKSVEISEEELRETLLGMKASSLSEEEFNDLWKHALSDIEQAEDIIVRRIRQSVPVYTAPGEPPAAIYTTKKIFQSRSHVLVPFSCRIQLAITGALARHRTELRLALGSIVASIIGYILFLRRQAHNRAVEELTERAVSVLTKQQQISDADTTGRTVRYVAVPLLRDSLVTSRVGADVWSDVVKAVEANGNVRARQNDVHGEITKIWEWLGTVSLDN